MGLLERWVAPARTRRVERRRRRFGQLVTIRPVARRADGSIIRDGYGKPTYGVAAQHPARVEGKVQMVRTATGQERASNTTILLTGQVASGTEDELTLPDGTRPPILSIDTIPGVGEDTGLTILYT